MSKLEKQKQYFVALIPPTSIKDAAQGLKEYFREKYQSKAALNSPPHITLHMPFRWNEAREAKLFDKLREFARRCDPVKVCLDNFSSFAPRVIFLNVTQSDSLDRFQQDMHRFFKLELNIFNANYQDRPFHPHLTLAFRDLKKAQFHSAWEEFSKKEYKAEFIADKLVLLKHNGKSWDILKDFSLESSYSSQANALDTTEG